MQFGSELDLAPTENIFIIIIIIIIQMQIWQELARLHMGRLVLVSVSQ